MQANIGPIWWIKKQTGIYDRSRGNDTDSILVYNSNSYLWYPRSARILATWSGWMVFPRFSSGTPTLTKTHRTCIVEVRWIKKKWGKKEREKAIAVWSFFLAFLLFRFLSFGKSEAPLSPEMSRSLRCTAYSIYYNVISFLEQLIIGTVIDYRMRNSQLIS